jgi:hypothetical protein
MGRFVGADLRMNIFSMFVLDVSMEIGSIYPRGF